MMVRLTIDVSMKNWCILGMCLLLNVSSTFGQKYFSKTGRVNFTSNAPLEKIVAHNNNAYVILDSGNGSIECSVLIKGFQFEKALMQDHFNENYMESDKFPKSIFKGRITNISEVNFQKNGTYPVTIIGLLEIHGVTKEIATRGTIKVEGETVLANADFNVMVSDYNIAIPGLVKDKVSKTATIKVICNYKLLK